MVEVLVNTRMLRQLAACLFAALMLPVAAPAQPKPLAEIAA